MDTDELAKSYGQEAIDNVVVSELYTSLDCTDIQSNVYRLPVTDDDDAECEEVFEITFDKFLAEWAPFAEQPDTDAVDPVAEGERPVAASPEAMARGVAEYIYDSFTEAADTATYIEPDQDGIRGAIETYRMYTNRDPSVIIVDDDLLDEDVKKGIEEFEDVTIYESEYLDLGEELLISNKEIGYSAVRTEVDADSWVDGMHMTDPTLDNPLVTSVYTRRGLTETEPEYGLCLKPIGDIERQLDRKI